MKLDNIENFEMTVKAYDTNINIQYNRPDLTVDELFNAFFVIVRGLGWNEDTIREHILDLADEYRPPYDVEVPIEEDIRHRSSEIAT